MLSAMSTATAGDLLPALLLGAVQGLTEFLPISSSAHLVILPWLFGWSSPVLNSLPFAVALHLGTLTAVLLVFWRELLDLAQALLLSLWERRLGKGGQRRLAWLLVLGTLPGVAAGLWLEEAAATVFRSPYLVAAMLAGFGLVLWVVDRLPQGEGVYHALRWQQALLIGLAQALAIVPGVSRSGSTITAGMLLGLTRAQAARFSFLLMTPIVAGAGVLQARHLSLAQLSGLDGVLFGGGFASSLVVGYLCIRFFLRYLQRGRLWPFALYRLLLAGLIAVMLAAR